MVAVSTYELADRFRAERGRVFLTGTQALARIPVEQLRADRRDGHRTAAFVTGYPGSPLGALDGAMVEAARLAPDLPIVCRPGLNEEYAASAVMGSQLAAARPDARYDGVVGIWYGKAPGVDRATDALRHAVFAGTSRLGGAIAIVGDDPKAKSSTVPSSSAGVLADLHMPLFYPGDPAEALDLGRHAIALSRSTGLWAALKIVADVADGTASVDVDLDRIRPVLPTIDGRPFDKMPDGRLLTPRTLDLEEEIFEVRYPLAVAYASANQLNTCTVDPADAWIGIVSSGITYREVREALARIGLDNDADVAAVGIRLLKMQMPIPFNPQVVRDFARGLDEVFVIEEKQPNLESLVKDALYDMAQRPRVVGRRDEREKPLIQGFGGLDADSIIPGLRARLEPRLRDRLAPAPPPSRARIAIAAERSPFYCSGCPHNRSTEVPEGSLVGAGIGCHTMVLYMDTERVGEIAGMTPMGNEGTQWIGMSEFVERDHLIQNLGDGTYFHSGQLAITAAIAAGVNITYKLLYNGTIAMTGGQLPPGQIGVDRLSANLLNQGAVQVLITTDDPGKYDHVRLPHGVEVWGRDRLVEAQELLAKVPGVTVLIHDQACAAESRRARKRGLVPTPTQRIVINQRVCEGCGDCGRVSNCLSVQPVDTPYGRKTLIDQTSCNLDYSCLEGDCPSFMTVETAPARRSKLLDLLGRVGRTRSDHVTQPDLDHLLDAVLATPLPAPALATVDDFGLRVTGIGGTGVVTVAQVLGTAAMLDGYTVRGLDQIGLSQKAGPVVSDIRLTRDHSSFASRLGSEQADLLLACDQLVAASDKGLLIASPTKTVVVGSSSIVPTGAMVAHPDMPVLSPAELAVRIRAATRADRQHWADAAGITTAVFGDSVTANFFVIGMATQTASLPIAPELIEEAIRLNGTAVDANVRAYRLGRHQIVDPTAVDDVVRSSANRAAPPTFQSERLLPRIAALGGDEDFRSLVERLTADLVGYQGERYAARFVETVEQVVAREQSVAPGSFVLASSVARNLHKLLAYKDEYEVGRLLLDRDARHDAERLANGRGRISYQLHPPLLRSLGLDHKIALGPWSDPVFGALARAKFLRGTPFDPFRWSEVRRIERKLPGEYRKAIRRLLAGLRADRLAEAARIAELPDHVRGYEQLKVRRAGEYREMLREQLAHYANG
jgi:indolepyruvate ferredoxin oxidoreductase